MIDAITEHKRDSLDAIRSETQRELRKYARRIKVEAEKYLIENHTNICERGLTPEEAAIESFAAISDLSLRGAMANALPSGRTAEA